MKTQKQKKETNVIIIPLRKEPVYNESGIVLHMDFESFDYPEDVTRHWLQLLCNPIPQNEDNPDLTKYLKGHRVWFIVGHPKNNKPRLEADIMALHYNPETYQLSFEFASVKEMR